MRVTRAMLDGAGTWDEAANPPPIGKLVLMRFQDGSIDGGWRLAETWNYRRELAEYVVAWCESSAVLQLQSEAS